MFDAMLGDPQKNHVETDTFDPFDAAALYVEGWDLEASDSDATDLDPLEARDGPVVPEGLESMRPGLFLAAALFSIDVTGVSGHDRIRLLRAHRAMVSYFQARLYADMASIPRHMVEDAEASPETADEAAATEIRAALRLTRRAADSELSFALEIQRRLPVVWDALVAGRIDVRRAKAIVYGTSHLDDAAARAVVDTVIDGATEWTTGQLAARLRSACIEVDPGDAKDRYEARVEDRRVVTEPTTAGTANLLGLDLPPHEVTAATAHINRLARGLRTKDESRTMDQLRADVMLDLLTGSARTHRGNGGNGKGTGRGVVELRGDLDTFAGLSEAPGELNGFGPVIADIARQLADDHHDAEWRWTVTHPDTELPIATGVTKARPTSRRRPTAAQRRHIQARDRTCVFPGCRMPSTGCDIDHREPWAEGGATTVCNCGPLCRHDHGNKHRHGWTYRPLPHGDYLWTSPLGHRYTTSGRPP